MKLQFKQPDQNRSIFLMLYIFTSIHPDHIPPHQLHQLNLKPAKFTKYLFSKN